MMPQPGWCDGHDVCCGAYAKVLHFPWQCISDSPLECHLHHWRAQIHNPSETGHLDRLPPKCNHHHDKRRLPLVRSKPRILIALVLALQPRPDLWLEEQLGLPWHCCSVRTIQPYLLQGLYWTLAHMEGKCQRLQRKASPTKARSSSCPQQAKSDVA